MHSFESVKATLQPFFDDRPEVILVYLFGSFLRRPKGNFHDIDLALLVDHDQFEALDRARPYGYRASLGTDLAHTLRYDIIDVTILNFASPLLLKRIIRTGELIFCRAERNRIEFEISAFKRFADTANLRAIKRRYTKERIKTGLTAYVRSATY